MSWKRSTVRKALRLDEPVLWPGVAGETGRWRSGRRFHRLDGRETDEAMSAVSEMRSERERKRRSVPLLLAALWLGGLGLAGGPALEAGELRVELDAQAGLRNDGNIRQTDLGAGEPLETEDESVARGGFDLKLSYGLPRLDLALTYSPAYERSLDDESLTGTTHRLELGLDGALTRRLTMRIRERLLKAPNLDLYVPLDSPEPVAVTERGDQLGHSLDVSFDHDLTRRTSLIIGAEHTLRTFETSELYDTETLGGRLGWGFDVTEDRRFQATATAGQFDFEERGEADVQTLGLSYADAWGLGGRWSIEAGMFAVDSTRRRALVALPDNTDIPQTEVVEVEESDTGWRGGLQVAQQRRLFGWSLGYRHDISAGYGLGRATETDSVFAGISTTLGRRLTLGLDGNASRHRDLLDDDAELPTEPGEPAAARDDSLNEFAAGTIRFNWTIFQPVRLTGGYSRIWQESRVEPFEDLSYSRYFLGLAVRVFSFGETPNEPDLQGEPTDEEEPDAD